MIDILSKNIFLKKFKRSLFVFERFTFNFLIEFNWFTFSLFLLFFFWFAFFFLFQSTFLVEVFQIVGIQKIEDIFQ